MTGLKIPSNAVAVADFDLAFAGYNPFTTSSTEREFANAVAHKAETTKKTVKAERNGVWVFAHCGESGDAVYRRFCQARGMRASDFENQSGSIGETVWCGQQHANVEKQR